MTPQPPTAPRTLLIVEDDLLIATLYQRRFEQAGYKVEVCSDGQAAFYRLHETTFSAVLMDLMLPQMNGVQILGKIRAQKRFATLPVIVLTNAHLDDLAGKAVTAGATRVFFKSTVTPTAVLGAVNACLSGEPSPPDHHASLSQNRVAGLDRSPALSYARFSAERAAETSFREPTERRTGSLLLAEEAAFHAPLTAGPTANPAVPTVPEHASVPTLEECDAAVFAADQRLKDMRRWLKNLQKASSSEQRLESLHQLVRVVHWLQSPVLAAAIPCLSRISEAFEALLWELAGDPSGVNDSTLLTLSRAVDCLGTLISQRADIPAEINPSVLVLDDDLFSRRAMVRSLAKVNISPTVMDNPRAALEALRSTTFDLVILDVRMPELNGFEVCKLMRSCAPNQKTPVIFVTSLNDFQSRVDSVLSGGHELIVKPYLLVELAVKVLVLAIRQSLHTHKAVL